MNKISGIKDWKHSSLVTIAARLVLAVGVAGIAVQGDTAAYAQTSIQVRSLDVVSMDLLTESAGWVADDNHVLWTRDYGLQWTDITPADLATHRIQSVFFRTELEGWIVATSDTGGELTVRRTQDGGTTWTRHALATLGDGGSPISIDFTDGEYGWVMVQVPSSANFSLGLVLATTDGGQSWKALPSPPIGGQLHFISRTIGWLAGGPAGDQLYVTRDGGQHWERQVVGPPATADIASRAMYQLPTFRTERDGVLPVVFSGPGSSLLATYETSDSGATWRSKTPVALPAASELDGRVVASVVNADTVVVAPDRSTDVVVMADGVQRSFRRSANLSPQQTIVGMDFQTADRGWLTLASGQCAAGKSQCRQERRLFTTTDGGRTMHDITPPAIGPSPGATTNRVFLSVGKGFDKCTIGTVSQMQAWWTNTPWSWANIYIGGANRGCSQAGLNSGWVRSIFAQGWRLVPTWVGLQAPGSSCTGCSKMSTSTTTARQQGINEANAAADAAAALGLPAPSIIYFDMERYEPTSHPAVKAFINAWVERLRQRGHQAGVYGAGINAANDWAPIANPPQAVWIANWNNNESVFGLSGLSNSLWATHQRIHQFQGPHNETWGGVTFNIDSDRADGPVADD